MSEELPTDQSPREEIGEKPSGRVMNPRSLANLAPRWLPGQSGNASGLTKDGRPTKSAPVSKALLERLEGKPTTRMVDRWVKDAIDHKDGHVRAKARAQILERLYPVVDDPTSGKTILEGLKLELSPGKASLTIARGQDVTSASESMTVTDGSEGAPGDGGDALEQQ